MLERGDEHVLSLNDADHTPTFNVDYCRLLPIADGGEVVIYAPHVREVSHVHGALIVVHVPGCQRPTLRIGKQKRAGRGVHCNALDSDARWQGIDEHAQRLLCGHVPGHRILLHAWPHYG